MQFQIHTRNTRSRSIDAATGAAGDFSGNLALERKNVRFNSTVEYVQGGIIGDPKMSLPADDEEGGASTKTPELNKGKKTLRPKLTREKLKFKKLFLFVLGEQECDFESVDVVVGGEDGLGKDVDVEEENGSGLGGGGGSFRKRSAAEMFQSIGLGPLCVKKKTSFGRVVR